jgi:tetratricopeptide (TPR) repeat protein
MTEKLKKPQILLIYIALAMVTIIAFEQVRNNDFTNYDDSTYVTENRHIQEGLTVDSVLWAFTATEASNWHPLTWISHMVDWQLFGPNAAGHHITNLLIHILNVLLLFGVLKAMTRAVWPSAFVAVLFAIHPLHVESVAWVAERKDVLSGLFWMLTMAAYAYYVKSPRIGRYLLVFLSFALGLMAKPMLVTLPFVLLLLDYWPLDRFKIQKENDKKVFSAMLLISEKIPLFMLSIFSCVITFIVQQGGGVVANMEAVSVDYRVANTMISYASYITKMIVPTSLAVLYPLRPSGTLLLPSIICGIILVAITIYIICWSRQKCFMVTGWLWYLGTLVPVIGLVQVGVQAMADRYTYLPSIGIFIIFAWSISCITRRWRYQRPMLIISAMAVIIALTICTRMQVKRWHNSITLFQHAIAVTNANYISYYNLGVAFKNKGEFTEAMDCYRKIEKMKPEFPEIYYSIGNLLKAQDKFDEALDNYRHALKLRPDYVDAIVNMATAMKMQGEMEQAVEKWKEAIEIDPDCAEAHSSLALAMAQQGKYNLAVEHFNHALRIEPDSESYYILGIIYHKFGKYGQAVENYKNAIRLEPDNPTNHFHIALTYSAVGDVEKAVYHYNEALKIKPDYADAFVNLGGVLKSQDKTEEAIEVWKKALEFQPENPGICLNLSLAMTGLGRYNQAVIFAEKACLLTDYKQPRMLDTLAIAYAATKDYNRAVETTQKAIDVCRGSGRDNLVKELEKKVELYRKKM